MTIATKHRKPDPGPCSMTKPCNNCPFLREGYIELNPGRVRGIVKHLLESDMHGFPCHKTTTAGGASGKKEKQCAGAMIYLLKAKRPNVLMRVCMSFRSLNVERLMRAAELVVSFPYRGQR
jgi:hypothetical protein